MSMIRIAVLIAAGVAAMSACGKKDMPPQPSDTKPPSTQPTPTPRAAAPAAATTARIPLSITAVALGRTIDTNQKIATPSSSFAPTDFIYASVTMAGSSSNGSVTARWTYQDGQTVNEASVPVVPGGPPYTAFHINKPSGFPAGKYKVDISLNGEAVASKDFEVK
jgi:hypothetical protein